MEEIKTLIIKPKHFGEDLVATVARMNDTLLGKKIDTKDVVNIQRTENYELLVFYRMKIE